MNIWLPIITNAIALIIVLCGVITGKKSKPILQISKIITLCGLGVACHFLIAPVASLLTKIPFLKNMHELDTLSSASINSISFALLFLTAYILTTIVFSVISIIISKKHEHGIKVSKTVRIKAAGKNKRIVNRIHKQPANILGCIFGGIIGLLMSFTLFLPVKYIFNDVSKVLDKPEINSGYEYTLYGQLDKLTGIDDIIIGE